jgi:hypothetical protein
MIAHATKTGRRAGRRNGRKSKMTRNLIGLVIVLAMGGGFIALGIYSYLDLAAWEEMGGRKRMHWAYALLYHEFGKWGPAAAFISAGWALICYTLYRFIYHRNDPDTSQASES